MPNIKFYRSETWPSDITPQEGFVWFNSTNNTIQLYKNGAWEVYTGKINDVTYTEGVLTITPHTGNPVLINLGNVANIEGLANRLGNLETSFSALSGKVTTLESAVSTNSTAVATVIKQLKNIQETEGAVKAYVDAQVLAEKTARENADSGFTTQISGLTTTTAGHTSAIDDLKTFVAFTDGVDVPTQITNAINALDNGTNGVSDTGEKVTVTVKQENGKVTSVTVSDSDIASAQALTDLTTTVANNKSDLEGVINTEKARIDTLVGAKDEGGNFVDAGKSVRTIANEELAAQLLAGPDGAVDNFKTLQELAAWLEEHPESAAAMNEAIGANTTAISGLTGRVGALESVKDDYKAADEATLTSAKSYADTKAATAESNAKTYTDALAEVVDDNTTAIATNTADITTIKGQITTINTTIEENELTTAAALTNLDERLTELSSNAVTSVAGGNYVTTSNNEGAVTVNVTTGALAGNTNGLALTSDVKAYVDGLWEWAIF